ncbi:MAG: hypothetical protein JJ934_19555 [Pseudomonadales bacterium]|nr:hypothetical protein [Pseudomonadales bacterium]MBO6659093.1 hypothetical protein [Pseudomonadales bacterium]
MKRLMIIGMLSFLSWGVNAAPTGWYLAQCSTDFFGTSYPQPTHYVELASTGAITDVDWSYHFTRQSNGQTDIGTGASSSVYNGMKFKKGENPVADQWRAWYHFNGYLVIPHLVGVTSIWMGDDTCESAYLYMGQYPIVI